MWRPDLAGKSGPKFKQISNAIGESIADGGLSVGRRLPPHRDLAYALGVSLNTVSRAYADAKNRGFLRGEVGRGTFVRASGPLPLHPHMSDMTRPDTGPIDFSLNLPVSGQASQTLAETLSELGTSNALASFLDYQTTRDQDRHAEAAVKWLARIGLIADRDDVVLTSGAQHGILVALLAMIRPGDVLLTEELTYTAMKPLAKHLGIGIEPVALREGVLCPQSLDAACHRVAAKLLYCLPTLHTPTTATMSSRRRSAIAEIARKHDLVIIEDDVFGFLPPQPPAPLARLAPDRTIYITSVSKCLAPGLRVGYLCAPSRYVRSLRAAVNLSCWMPPPLMAEIATRWIEDGTAEKLNEFQRNEAAARQSMARELLPATHIHADPNGFHLWLTLPTHWRPDAFRMAAETRGVKLLLGAAFAVNSSHEVRAIRLCLSHEKSRTRIKQGLMIIADLLKDTEQNAPMIL